MRYLEMLPLGVALGAELTLEVQLPSWTRHAGDTHTGTRGGEEKCPHRVEILSLTS